MLRARLQVALFAAVAACSSTGGGKGGKPFSEASMHDPRGEYWCTIGDTDFTGPRYPCVIKDVRTRLLLGKLSGSERIRGEVTPADDGFLFVGEFYCPWGDCQHPLQGRFKSTEQGGYVGTFRDDSRVVRLDPAPKGTFAGSEFGGDEYGDPFGYIRKGVDSGSPAQ